MEEEEMVLPFKDRISSLEDSSSSEEEDEKMEDKDNGQDSPGLLREVRLRSTSMPTVTELWPQFRQEKALRFLRLFDNQKTPTMWQRVRRRMRRKKLKNRQNPSKPIQGSPQIVRPPGPEECLTDDEIKMKAPVAPQPDSQLADCSQDSHLEVAPWRYGPAKLWYDMLEVSPHGRGFDYGFKLKEKSQEEEEATTQTDHPLLNIENFLMVTQKTWEDDIIWDIRDVQDSSPHAQKVSHAGWIPSQNIRSFKGGACDQSGGSLFVPENDDLTYSRWEDDIIWDAQAMHKPLYPTVPTIDQDDKNLMLFDIEEPIEVETSSPKPSSQKGKNMPRCDMTEQTPACLKAKDPWNLSNDEFYFPQQHGLQVSLKIPIIQHSTPALELHFRLFPTHMGVEQLRLFHRPPLRWLGRGPHPVHNLTVHIRKKAQKREQELQASGGGHMFFMKTIQDLSGKDGDIVLFEWSEENPPLLSQVGMASQIQNYYKRKIGKDSGPPAYKYGNLVFCSTSPFLGQLQAGQFLQALENNLFRAPIYAHEMAGTDFLVVVTNTGCFLREVKDIFAIGQQCPLDEVPAPKSKMAKNYSHTFLQVFIYRQFQNSPFRPRRIRMEVIRKAFPTLSETSIRRRLVMCSDFHRSGIYFNWWVLKARFRLPSEEELRVMMTPEKCCALYSMLAAQQRLKDAGYGGISLLDTEGTNDDSTYLDDEVQAAPWNTTRTFLAATKGQCLLEVTGAADPTGCGEGISYVKLKQENKTHTDVGRVMGTDADLRRLTLREAQKFLRTFGVSEEEIKKLSRWEVIAAVRALSTEKLSSGAKPGTLTRFARMSQSLGAEQQKHFQQEVQRIFDLQNRVLASTEVLSTDTDSSTSDEENGQNIDKMCHEVESLLDGKMNPKKLQRQKEEEEYQEMKRLMLGDGNTHLQDKSKGKKQDSDSPTLDPSSLIIHRTYIDDSGQKYERSEIVQDPAVIKAYIHVRTTKSEDFIRQISQLDEQKQQELRKEKKRLQDRVRRMEISEKMKEKKAHLSPKKLLKPETPKLNLICGACGSIGHMKTNKMCSKYCPPKDLAPRLRAMTKEQEERELARRLPQDSLIKIQGTKMFMKKKLVEVIHEVQRETKKMVIEKQTLPHKSQFSKHQKRVSMHMDPDEGLSCIRNSCRPAPPGPLSKRHKKSSHPVSSPLYPSKNPRKTSSGKFTDKSSRKTLPSPVQLAQNKPEASSCPHQKYKGSTQPRQKGSDFIDKTQKPVISPPKVLQTPPHDKTPEGLAPKHQISVLYEDLQVSDTDEEEEKEEI